jgi:hypothetical protein
MNKTSYKIEDIVEQFNKTIKKIINIMYNSGIDNILLDTIKRKIYLAINTNPLMLITELGPDVFIFRNYIKSGLDDLVNNYEDILKNNKELNKRLIELNYDKNNNYIDNILKSLQTVWKSYSNMEKNIVRKQFTILLSEYCKYITIKNN